MSVSHPDQEAELYCKPNDVRRFIRPRDGSDTPQSSTADEFGDTTIPTRDDVVKHIQSASTRMDRKTQQSWRASQVTDATYDHKGLYYWLSGHPLDLEKKNLRPMSEAKGDKLEVWTGNKWEEWVSDPTKEQGRDGDYWIDAPNGLLWVYERAILRPHPKFRLTYRYGYDHVPADIRDAVAKKAAADIISGDFYGTVVPGNNQGENADPARVADKWREEFNEVARTYKKVSFI